MDRIVYMEKLFSKRREKLVDKCIELQRQGKRFLYIMPSSAAIFQVRSRFLEDNKGFLGSRVIVFDDLEMDIVKHHIPMDRVIYEPIDRVMISEICSRLKDSFKYYQNIYDKKGFHQETVEFIRTLKRNCIDEEGLSRLMENTDEEVLKDKLSDLCLIYENYNKSLKDNVIYDRNDISVKAVELASKYRELNKIDTIVIDGFTDIEIASMKLIESIAENFEVNIYVNCPYANKFIGSFIEEEIKKPFLKMGFEILDEAAESYEASPWIYDLGNKFYSSEKISEDIENLSITKYPCIESEVRETARSIKERIMSGENPDQIAVYINNRDDYSESMINIFREFKIPLSMSYELPLADSELARKIIRSFEAKEEQYLAAAEWLKELQLEVDSKKEYMLELVKKAVNGEIDFVDKLEIKSFDALRKLVEETRLSFEKSSMLNGLMSRGYFIEFMLEGIISVNVEIEQGNNSGVRVLNTALAKGVYYNHVYILGLNEGEIPAVVKNNGLFDFYEVSKLKDLGIRYRDYIWELTREKIRFNLSIASARESVALSYRGADEEGKFAIASPFIDEIKYLCSREKANEISMRNRFELPLDNVMSEDELRAGYIKSCFGNKYKNLESMELERQRGFVNGYSCDVEEILKSGMVEYLRDREKDFGEYEGIMGEDFSNTADLICKFSPSALNTYLECPFKYLVTQLYQPGEEPKDEEEYSSLETGEFYHSVLYKYYRGLQQYVEFDVELFDRVFEEAYEDLRNLSLEPEETDKKKAQLRNTLVNFLKLDLERLIDFESRTGNILRPVLLEGMIQDASEFGVSISCKIDRVDAEYRLEKGKKVPTGKYVIYDYKKKSVKGINEILNNKDYQLPIYYFLVEKELKNILGPKSLECMALLYLSLEGSDEKKIELDGLYKTEYKKLLGITKRGDIRSDNFPELMNYIKGLIIDTISLIKSGRFNYKPMCSQFEGYSAYSCQYAGLCRYSRNKIRVLAEDKI